jgi:hypothetical protein
MEARELLPVLLPKLLEAPFLLFVAVVVFLCRFRRELTGLLSRGDILISWGEKRSIRLRELSKSLDEELEPIRDDIETLKRSIGAGSEPTKVSPPVPPREADEDRKQIATRIREGLRSSEFTWRSVERLAAVSGTTESQVLEILRADPDVRLSVGKSGRQIAGLKSRVGA